MVSKYMRLRVTSGAFLYSFQHLEEARGLTGGLGHRLLLGSERRAVRTAASLAKAEKFVLPPAGPGNEPLVRFSLNQAAAALVALINMLP